MRTNPVNEIKIAEKESPVTPKVEPSGSTSSQNNAGAVPANVSGNPKVPRCEGVGRSASDPGSAVRLRGCFLGCVVVLCRVEEVLRGFVSPRLRRSRFGGRSPVVGSPIFWGGRVGAAFRGRLGRVSVALLGF